MNVFFVSANYDLKKYSYVTCRGEQSPSKFDTYLCQVKSTFGCEADLNTLTARQLKSTLGTKRLMCLLNMPDSTSLNINIVEVRITQTVLWFYEFFTSFVCYQWRHEMVNVL